MTSSRQTSSLELNNVFEACLHAVQNRQATVDECLAAYPQHAEALASLLDLALQLRSLPRPELADEQVAAIERVVTAHTIKMTSQRPAISRRWSLPFFTNRFARLGTVLTVVLALVIVSGVGTVAANQSLPGQPLYPLKRGLEQARLILTSDSRKPQRLTDMAQERLEEVEQLAQRDNNVKQDVIDDLLEATDTALDALEDTPADQREGLSEELGNLTQHQQEVLSQLIETAPEASKKGLERALEASQHGHQRANAARSGNGNQGRGAGPPGGEGPLGLQDKEEQDDQDESHGNHGAKCELPPCNQGRGNSGK